MPRARAGHPEGRDRHYQGDSLAHYPAGKELVHWLTDYVQQFELFFTVDATSLQIYLEQSHIRFQERVRKNPMLDSVWVENPADRQELVLMDPNTGRVREQGPGKAPVRLRKGLAASSLRTDPPCGLPKVEAYSGNTHQVKVEFPEPGNFLGLCKNGQQVRTKSPRALELSLAQAAALGLIDPDNIDPVADFCDAGNAVEAASNFTKAFNAPMVERLAHVLIAADKKLRIETGVTPDVMADAVKQALITAATADLSTGDPTEDLVDHVSGMLFGQGSEQEFRRALNTILTNQVPADKIVVTPPNPDLLTISLVGTSLSIIDHDAPEISLLNPRKFVLERQPSLRLRPLATIAEAMLNAVALSPDQQSTPLNVFARGLGEIAADILLSRFPVVALPLIILESFATTDNSEDFIVAVGSKSAGLLVGKFVRTKTGIDQKMAQAVSDPRIKLGQGASNLVTTFAGQTLETGIDQGVQATVEGSLATQTQQSKRQ